MQITTLRPRVLLLAAVVAALVLALPHVFVSHDTTAGVLPPVRPSVAQHLAGSNRPGGDLAATLGGNAPPKQVRAHEAGTTADHSPQSAAVVAGEAKSQGQPSVVLIPGLPECARRLFEAQYDAARPAALDATAAFHDPLDAAAPRTPRTFATNAHSYRRGAAPGALNAGIPEVEAVYMVHYTPMRDRRVNVSRFLARHGVGVDVWVTPFDREAITANMSACLHGSWPLPSALGQDALKAAQSNRAAGGAGGMNVSEVRAMLAAKRRRHNQKAFERLRPSQVSVVTKHHFAMYDVVRQGRGLAMVLEDDALLRLNFTTKLNEVLSNIPRTKDGAYDFDVAMIGGCLKMVATRRKYNAKRIAKHVYEKREARCAHAYLVTAAGARKLLASLPLTSAIDFQINAAMKETQMRGLWIEPRLSVQGKLDDICVTKELGAAAKCPAAEYDRAFDPNLSYARDPWWDKVT